MTLFFLFFRNPDIATMHGRRFLVAGTAEVTPPGLYRKIKLGLLLGLVSISDSVVGNVDTGARHAIHIMIHAEENVLLRNLIRHAASLQR
jgi:hypothetical protein